MDSGLPVNLGAQFEARFDGNCKTCTCAIYEGDLMGWVDEVAVCGDCYQEGQRENHEFVRDESIRRQAEERAKDPEGSDRRQAAVKKWTDSVKARAAQDPGKEWVPIPGGNTPGWVRNPDHEPLAEEATDVAIEPGIQALMAAGLLQGQEPGGSGVCPVTIETAGIVTEVEIPVEVDPPAAKAARKSRAKVKAEAPSASSAEGPAAALAQQRERMATLSESALAKTDERLAELTAAADAFLPGQVEADVLASRGIDVHGPAPVVVDPLQASLQSAVNAGVMTCAQAEALGWVDPVLKMIQEDNQVMGGPNGLPGSSPRTQEPLETFMKNPATTVADIFLDALAGAASPAEEDAILSALDNLPPYEGIADKKRVSGELKAVIVNAIENHPRSLQKKIGPSEIGTPCDHCLAAKLAGWDQVRGGEAWLPTVGTAVHSWLQAAFEEHNRAAGTSRYLLERRVAVGEIDGEEITGSTDLVDVVAGWTWDWKIVGPTTLKSAKVGPSPTYIVQQMLYARGWRRLGVIIDHVGIAYLPRNAVTLSAAVWWSAPYDEQIALDALERANRLAVNLRAMEALGADVRDKYITGLDRWREYRQEVNGVEVNVTGNAQEGRIVCMDCPRFPDYPEDPAAALKQLDGLL